MITLEALRSAVLSTQPATELDRIIRAELAAGRLVKTILAEYSSLLDSARETPGLTEDADDALRDVFDGLTGNCAPRWRYSNPPILPSEAEIAELPWGARIAFAARCARRVVTLYRWSWPDAPPEAVAGLMMAVEHAEQAAAKPAAAKSIEAAMHAKYAAQDANKAALAGDALTATHSASAAWNAVLALNGSDASVTRSALAAYEATIAAEVVLPAGSPVGFWDGFTDSPGKGVTVAALRRDFDQLAGRAKWQHWDDDTPVPPTIFGPLWPEGAPPGWPADPDTPKRDELPLHNLVKEGVLDKILVDEIVNLFNAVNRYHIARCSVRLTLEGDIFTLLTALVPAGGVR